MSELQQIEALIDRARMPVAYDRAGEPRSVPPIVGDSAVRVVRDALDAAVCATEASVAIEFVPGALVVQVEDDCRCARDLEDLEALAAGLGGGLIGRRMPEGSFRVRAWLPTEGLPPFPAAPPAAR